MRRFSFLTIFLFPFSLSAIAQEITLQKEVTSNGEVAEMILTPEQSNINLVEFWIRSSGNETMPVSIYVEGPNGAKVTTKAVLIAGSSAEEKIASSAGWYPLKLKGGGDKEKAEFTIRTSTAAVSVAPMTTSICSLLSPDQIKSLLNLYESLYGRPFTKEELCGGTIDTGPDTDPDGDGDISDTPTPASSNGTLNLTGLFSKDTCRADKKSNYLLKVSLDLSAVDPALKQGGLTLRGAILAKKFKGCKAASIKPESDGKFAPRPLLLMCSLGSYYYGGQGVNLIQWRRGRPVRPRRIKVYDFVYWRGYVLTRSPLSGLRGGRGTFELTNGSSAYSVCFNLSATRQRVNGYP